MAVQVFVHIARLEGVALPIDRVVLKQVLTGNFFAFAHQPGEAGITQGHVVRHAFLPDEAEVNLSPAHGYVFILQGGQAIALVLFSVFLIAHPDEGLVHEQQHQRYYFFAVERGAAQVAVELLAQWQQLLAKGA